MWVSIRSEDRSWAGTGRVVHEHEQLRLDQEQVSDPLALDGVQGGDRLEVVLQDDGAAAEQGLVDQDLGEVGQLAVGQLAAVRGRSGRRDATV